MSHISHVLAPSLELIEATRKAGFEEETTYIPNGVDTKDLLLMGLISGLI